MDGGPAFPMPWSVDDRGKADFICTGMSLRDWFAGQVLVGCDFGSMNIVNISDDDLLKMSAQAYRIADAMLKAREQSHD